MFACPSIGAFAITVSSGWMARVRRHGLAIALAACAWGLAIVAFGLAPDIAWPWWPWSWPVRPTW